jgi:hypothetical protein
MSDRLRSDRLPVPAASPSVMQPSRAFRTRAASEPSKLHTPPAIVSLVICAIAATETRIPELLDRVLR